MEYRKEIDGLRAVAVLAVIFFHAGFESFSGGYVGVDIFFVISGFLITSMIASDLEKKRFSLLDFYERRARRILPALLFLIICCIPAACLFLLPEDLEEFFNSVLSVIGFYSNFFFWKSQDYFGQDAELIPLIHTWTIAVEEQYYIFFPLLLIFLSRQTRSFKGVALLCLFVVSLAYSIWASYHYPDAAFFLLPTRIWEFLIGSFAALYFQKVSILHSSALRNLLSLIGLLLILGSIFGFHSEMLYPSFYALLPTLGTALVIVFSKNTWVGNLLSLRFVGVIGLVSYSAYLWHQPIFAFFRLHYSEVSSALAWLALSGLVLIFAVLSYKLVEVPFRSKSFLRRSHVLLCFVSIALPISILALVGSLKPGILSRFNDVPELTKMRRSELSAYVNRRFALYIGAEFDLDDSRKKVLLIGDSYAKDLVNALAEANLLAGMQLSTYLREKRCGVLFIESSVLREYWAAKDAAECEDTDMLNNQGLHKLMHAADEIWFASSWVEWHMNFIHQSVLRVERMTNKPVKVFGRKNFGKVNLRTVFSIPLAERASFDLPVPSEVLTVNARMKSELGARFIDLQSLVCHSESRCSPFTDSGALISHDGGHLTKEGAYFLGMQLRENGVH